MKNFVTCFFCLVSVFALHANMDTIPLLRVAVAGLNHDHVNNIMNQYKSGEVIIIGIAESDGQLRKKYQARFALPDSLFYNDLITLLNHVKPDIVLAYNPIADHVQVVETCAPRGISVMVEKPLATTVNDAEHMAALARQFHIKLLTNYETTWYSTNQQVGMMAKDEHQVGDIVKMIVHDGHQGPAEIGCSPDFLKWLTDPVKNGGGALMDFGCYGANLMTWMMNNKAPVSVMAITHHIKPQIYPKVDDDATIILEYPAATGIIEASWNWPFGIKDFEVFGKTGYLHALNGEQLIRRDTSAYRPVTVQPYIFKDNIQYLSAILKGSFAPGNDLSSLENNLIVVKILEAAKVSAVSGKKVKIN